jgi:hypothetical protein
MSSLVSLFAAGAGDIIKNSAGSACGSSCTNTTVASLFKTGANTLIFLIGSLSVIMIIYGGIRYVISRGDSSAVAAAKNTIIYAVAGIVVAIAAFAIVAFVTTSVK